MNKEELFEALKNATNGTFEGSGIRTMLGWEQEYDKQGRPLRADPNYLDYVIKIDGKTYKITKVGWSVYVWKPEFWEKVNYCTLWNAKSKEEKLLYLFDITPDYVKEYYAEKELSRKTE